MIENILVRVVLMPAGPSLPERQPIAIVLPGNESGTAITYEQAQALHQLLGDALDAVARGLCRKRGVRVPEPVA